MVSPILGIRKTLLLKCSMLWAVHDLGCLYGYKWQKGDFSGKFLISSLLEVFYILIHFFPYLF